MTPAQIGILKDIKAARIDLDEIGDWMREQLAQITFHSGPLLIETQGPSVYLTTAGEAYLQTVLQGRKCAHSLLGKCNHKNCEGGSNCVMQPNQSL